MLSRSFEAEIEAKKQEGQLPAEWVSEVQKSLGNLQKEAAKDLADEKSALTAGMRRPSKRQLRSDSEESDSPAAAGLRRGKSSMELKEARSCLEGCLSGSASDCFCVIRMGVLARRGSQDERPGHRTWRMVKTGKSQMTAT